MEEIRIPIITHKSGSLTLRSAQDVRCANRQCPRGPGRSTQQLLSTATGQLLPLMVECGFCHNTLYCDSECLTAAWLDGHRNECNQSYEESSLSSCSVDTKLSCLSQQMHSGTHTEMVELKQSKSSEWGAYLKQPILQGDLIMVEDPLVMCSSYATSQVRPDPVGRRLTDVVCGLVVQTLRRNITVKKLQRAYHFQRTAKDNDGTLESLDHLDDQFTIIAQLFKEPKANIVKMYKVLKAYCFGICAPFSQQEIAAALYERAGLIAHSCQPNAVFTISADGRFMVYAVCDIPQGGEVTIALMEHMLQTVWERRQSLLWDRLGGPCRCQRCLVDQRADKRVKLYRQNCSAKKSPAVPLRQFVDDLATDYARRMTQHLPHKFSECVTIASLCMNLETDDKTKLYLKTSALMDEVTLIQQRLHLLTDEQLKMDNVLMHLDFLGWVASLRWADTALQTDVQILDRLVHTASKLIIKYLLHDRLPRPATPFLLMLYMRGFYAAVVLQCKTNSDRTVKLYEEYVAIHWPFHKYVQQLVISELAFSGHRNKMTGMVEWVLQRQMDIDDHYAALADQRRVKIQAT